MATEKAVRARDQDRSSGAVAMSRRNVFGQPAVGEHQVERRRASLAHDQIFFNGGEVRIIDEQLVGEIAPGYAADRRGEFHRIERIEAIARERRVRVDALRAHAQHAGRGGAELRLQRQATQRSSATRCSARASSCRLEARNCSRQRKRISLPLLVRGSVPRRTSTVAAMAHS